MEPTDIISPSSYQSSEPRKRRPLLVFAIAVFLVMGIAAAWLLVTKDDAIGLQAPAATISISADGFSPSTVTIKQGQAVTWVNKDEAEHQVTADESVIKDLQSADALKTNESYTYPFDDKGKFPYFDPLDPERYVGTIIVE